MDVWKVLDYNYRVRHRWFDFFETLPWEESVRNREASHLSMRNVLLHILEVEDWWIHHVIAGRPEAWQDYDFDAFTSVDAVRKKSAALEAATRKWFAGLSPSDLDRHVAVPPSDGKPEAWRSEDILLHVAFEELHHRGELIALLWQLDREPPPMEWLDYLAPGL